MHFVGISIHIKSSLAFLHFAFFSLAYLKQKILLAFRRNYISTHP
jgi:hypothetical protein